MAMRRMAVAAVAILGAYGLWQAGDRESVAGPLECGPEMGSSSPFPETGPMALEAEQERAKKDSPRLAQAGSAQTKSSASVWLINSGDAAAEATLFDEDGAPAARAFARAGEQAKLDVPPGAYTAWVTTGPDWTGSKFASRCAVSRSARGVAVAGAGQASLLAIAPGRGFVMANRLERAEAEAIVSQAAQTRKRGSAGGRESVDRQRPTDRPGTQDAQP